MAGTVKSIEQIVRDMGLGLTDQQVSALDEAVRGEYVTRAEHAEKVARIEALSQQVADLTARAKELDGDSAELEQLKAQVAAYEQAEQDRQAKEADAKKRAEFEAKLSEAVGKRQFANAMTRKAVHDAAWERHKANPDMSAADVLRDVVGDEQGVWANAQSDPHKMPVGSDSTNAGRADVNDLWAQLFPSGK